MSEIPEREAVETEIVKPIVSQFILKELQDVNKDEMGSFKEESISNESIISCRICKFGGGPDLIPSPCLCKGSLGTIHVSCLEEWLTGSTRDSCELCSFPFNVVRTRRFTCFQSILFFLKHRVNLIRLFRDLFFLGVSLMNTSVLLYIWSSYLLKILWTVTGSKPSEIHETFATMSVVINLNSLAFFFLFTLCLTFVSINALDDIQRISYFYFRPWYHCWQDNVDVKVVIDETEANPEDK